MSSRIEVSVPPADEPLTAADVREHLRIDHTDDTDYIDRLIVAAREHAEKTLNISLMTQTLIMWLDAVPSTNSEEWWSGARVGAVSQLTGYAAYIELCRGPVLSVTSYETLDDDNNATLWASTNYYLTAPQSNVPPARLVKKSGSAWPITDRDADAIKITFVAGFGPDAVDVPMDMKQGLLILIAHWYGLGRQAVISGETTSEIDLTLKEIWGKYYELRF